MTAAAGYLIGMGTVTLAGFGVSLLIPEQSRVEVIGGLLIALAVQAPLGWWTLRSIGSSRFQLVWSLGMLARLGMVALVGGIGVPALGWSMGPALGTLVAAIMALLLVEAATAARQHSWGKG